MELSNNVVINAPRKRGRPRKNKTIEKPLKVPEKRRPIREIENREIILHLPLFGRRTNSSPDSEKNAFTMGENDDIKSESEEEIEEIRDVTEEAILTISDQESPKSDDEDNLHMGELINELKKKNKIIKQLKEDNQNLKTVVGENAFMSCREVKTIPMNVNFVSNKDGSTIICNHTNIACWWCTYQFDTLPCFIPERFYDNKFYVFGCFCSFDCATAYNLSLNDYKVSDRNSLIKKLYSAITGSNEEIPIAPSREVLERYGGPVTIDEYRKLSRSINKEYKLILPPLVNLIACVEERTKDKSVVKSSIPEVKRQTIDEKCIIPVKKKLLHDGEGLNIMDTLGIKEKRKGFF